jgi:hypothetical protein
MAPRDGSGVYHRPPGTDAITQTTIASTPYNADVADVEQDLNTPRPIVAGGTAATSPDTALKNLSGEKASQVVTDFNTTTWMAGSFYAATTAANSPVAGHAFAGICYYADATNLVTEARDITDPAHLVSTRIMSGGVWGAWVAAAKAYADTKVAKAGDTMTGALTMAQPADNSQALILTNSIAGSFSKTLRMGGNAFQIINAANTVTLSSLDDTGNQSFSGNITAGLAGTTGSYYFGNTAARYLNYDGTNFNFNGGNLKVAGVITSNASATTGAYYFGNSGTKYLNYDGAAFNFAGGSVLATSKGNQLGLNGGTSWSGALTPPDANCLGYNGGGGNWAGWGVDNSGDFWIRTGLSGTAPAGFAVLSNGQVAIASFVGFYPSGTMVSCVLDNGTSIIVSSNANSTAGMYIPHGTNAWVSLSDARLPYKKTARKLNVLDKIDAIQLYENEVDGRLELFGKAQEIHTVFPHIVKTGDDDATYTPTGLGDERAWGLSYERIGIVALQAVKELLAKVEGLEAKIAALEAK